MFHCPMFDDHIFSRIFVVLLNGYRELWYDINEEADGLAGREVEDLLSKDLACTGSAVSGLEIQGDRARMYGWK